MKFSQARLLKLADKFGNKYAQSQTLQQIIEAAAGWGEKSANGIMNFPAMLKQDQADLSISVTVETGFMGSWKVSVSAPVVDPSQFASKYAALSKQIETYLNKHISNFPQVPAGTTTLSWSGKNAESGVAAK